MSGPEVDYTLTQSSVGFKTVSRADTRNALIAVIAVTAGKLPMVHIEQPEALALAEEMGSCIAQKPKATA